MADVRDSSASAADDLQPVEPPEDHDCEEHGADEPRPRGEVTAEGRGWGPGWPADNGSKMAVVRAGGIALSVRRELAPLVEWLVDETVKGGYALRHGECWGFNNRPIRGTKRPSNHSWGLAVDLNSLTNPMQATLRTDMPDSMVKLWKERSFRWGGDYRNRKDAMHFEFMGTPDDAAKLIANLGLPQVAGTTGGSQQAQKKPGTPTLKRKAKGDEVRVLQAMLNNHGASLEVDGVFGASTEEAVKAFQAAKGLQADGIVGPKTWEALA